MSNEIPLKQQIIYQDDNQQIYEQVKLINNYQVSEISRPGVDQENEMRYQSQISNFKILDKKQEEFINQQKIEPSEELIAINEKITQAKNQKKNLLIDCDDAKQDLMENIQEYNDLIAYKGLQQKIIIEQKNQKDFRLLLREIQDSQDQIIMIKKLIRTMKNTLMAVNSINSYRKREIHQKFEEYDLQIQKQINHIVNNIKFILEAQLIASKAEKKIMLYRLDQYEQIIKSKQHITFKGFIAQFTAQIITQNLNIESKDSKLFGKWRQSLEWIHNMMKAKIWLNYNQIQEAFQMINDFLMVLAFRDYLKENNIDQYFRSKLGIEMGKQLNQEEKDCILQQVNKVKNLIKTIQEEAQINNKAEQLKKANKLRRFQGDQGGLTNFHIVLNQSNLLPVLKALDPDRFQDDIDINDDDDNDEYEEEFNTSFKNPENVNRGLQQFQQHRAIPQIKKKKSDYTQQLYGNKVTLIQGITNNRGYRQQQQQEDNQLLKDNINNNSVNIAKNSSFDITNNLQRRMNTVYQSPDIKQLKQNMLSQDQCNDSCIKQNVNEIHSLINNSFDKYKIVQNSFDDEEKFKAFQYQLIKDKQNKPAQSENSADNYSTNRNNQFYKMKPDITLNMLTSSPPDTIITNSLCTPQINSNTFPKTIHYSAQNSKIENGIISTQAPSSAIVYSAQASRKQSPQNNNIIKKKKSNIDIKNADQRKEKGIFKQEEKNTDLKVTALNFLSANLSFNPLEKSISPHQQKLISKNLISKKSPTKLSDQKKLQSIDNQKELYQSQYVQSQYKDNQNSNNNTMDTSITNKKDELSLDDNQFEAHNKIISMMKLNQKSIKARLAKRQTIINKLNNMRQPHYVRLRTSNYVVDNCCKNKELVKMHQNIFDFKRIQQIANLKQEREIKKKLESEQDVYSLEILSDQNKRYSLPQSSMDFDFQDQIINKIFQKGKRNSKP